MRQRRFTYVLCPYSFGSEFEVGAEIGDAKFWINDKHKWAVDSDKRSDVPALLRCGVVGEMYPAAKIVLG